MCIPLQVHVRCIVPHSHHHSYTCRHQSQEEDSTAEIEDLKRELSRANELLASMKQKSFTLGESEVLSLSPAAAKASAMLKSGLSLTQIYSQYVEVSVLIWG